jgi:ribonuclease G
MSKELVISASPHETRVAIVEDGQLCEIYVEREKELALVGSIYKGRVTRVLPGMQSAFVDIGLDSDAFLYVSDFLEDLEEYDSVVTAVEGKVQKMEQQGGEVFSAPQEAPAAGEPPDVAPAATVEGEDAPPAPPAMAVPAATPPAGRSEDLPGESRSPSTGEPHDQRDSRFDPRQGFRGDRDRGGRRGGRGRDRFGRGDRGGRGRDRFGRGDRGGDRGPRNREFPASKYASHRPYEPPEEAPPGGEGLEPIILPGESLAKYRDRGPAVSQEGAAHTSSAQIESRAEMHADISEPLAAIPTLESEAAPRMTEPEREPHTEELRAMAAPTREELPAPAPSFAREPGHEAPPAVPEEDDLTDEQAANLAAQMAEVEHEQSQAAAELDEVEDENGAEEHGMEAASEEADEAEESAAPAFGGDETDQEIRQGILDAAGDFHEQPEHPDQPDRQPTQARVGHDPRARFQRPMRRGGRRRGGRGDRGDRPHFRRHQGGHGGHRPTGAPRRPQLISEMLKAGQEIIVQIAKEPLGKKGARITSHVALPGRYLVYMPTVNHIGVSRKIASAEKRSRLRHIVSDAKQPFPGGFIVRTAAETATEEEIRNDVEFLGRTWSEIRQRSEQRKAPAILHRDLNLVERILRDHLSSDYTAIWIDNEEEYTKVLEFVGRFQPQLANRVKLYTKEAHIFEEFGIQQEIDKSLRPKVWLKSGGYIVINHTEALVAIDVNTGKFVGKGSTRLEDTIVKTNLEAVREVVRQIRLRDLGGIIVIDFIDMEERRNREKVMAALDDALRRDRAPSKALGFNEFGLVAITRKRTKQALERVLCQPCPACSGSGMVKSLPTICYEIQSEARKMAPELDGASLTLRVHPEIAKALKTREAALVDELEKWTRKSVIIQSDPTLHWEQYDIY